MTRLSERLLRAQQVTLDTAALRSALRQLRQSIEKNDRHARAYADSLAHRPTIAVAKLERTPDGTHIVVHPARELSMFLRQAERERKRRDAA
jgi:hypothetical protein